MNTTMAVLERVAAGEITPEQAAEAMLEADKVTKAKRRPEWAPEWAWTLGMTLGSLALAIVGIRQD